MFAGLKTLLDTLLVDVSTDPGWASSTAESDRAGTGATYTKRDEPETPVEEGADHGHCEHNVEGGGHQCVLDGDHAESDEGCAGPGGDFYRL